MGKSEFAERRALSLRGAAWQSTAWATAGAAAVAAALFVAAPAGAVPGGKLGTLEIGRYTCERPGVAGSAASVPLTEASFRISTASSYRLNDDSGTYLLLGDLATMTSGSHKGRKFKRESRGFLRELGTGGAETDVRCVLAGR